MVCLVVLLLLVHQSSSGQVKQLCIIAPLSGGNRPIACELVTTEVVYSENYTLKIVPISSEVEFDTIVDFSSREFRSDQQEHGSLHGGDCSEVIGIVGDLDLKTANIVHTLASRANFSIKLVSAVAPSTFLPTTNLALPNLLHMNPLTHYVEALAAFLDHLNWTRIGLISDNTHYYEFAAELIQQNLLQNQRNITPFVRINEEENTTKTIQTFKECETDVVVILTSDEVACSLIQEARKLGFTWPKYALILFDVSFRSLLEACQDDGVILLTVLEESANHSVGCSFKERDNFLNSSIFLNSVLLAISADSKSLFNASLFGVNGTVKFREGKRLTNITIAQASNCRFREEIALYNSESQQLSIHGFFLAGDKPRGGVTTKHFRDAIQVSIIVFIFLISFAFITTVFTLYICFRKEPEIRATSVTVSLCMFLGSYILIVYLPLLVVEPTTDVHCNLLAWLSLCGIPFVLILATLFAKILRVYFILSDPFSFKEKLFSDPFLFLYILLLISPSLVILLIWLISDPFTFYPLESPQKSILLVHNRCLSKYTIGWLAALIVYIFILSFALLYLALKTSKIRFQHFRDTKATNAFACLSSFITTLTLIYWYFFYEQDLSVTSVPTSDGFLYIGHGSIALLCQVLLFVPKVYPPLKRRLTQKTERM